MGIENAQLPEIRFYAKDNFDIRKGSPRIWLKNMQQPLLYRIVKLMRTYWAMNEG